jgi:hypothetical protein
MQFYIKPTLMKNLIFFFWLFMFVFILSCTKDPEKNQLLDLKIDGQYFSFNGTAEKYTDYANDQKTAYDYQIYNHDRHTFLIEAYDNTFTKVIFPFPDFSAQYIVQLEGGQSKTYQAVSGQFRILGEDHGNLRGDFNFKAKNVLNASDSVVITEGYFDICLDQYDRTFPK